MNRSKGYKVEPRLINKNASPSAKRLMKYICDIYGNKILTGQQISIYGGGPEISTIFEETGKYPAVRGFDFVEYSPSRLEFGVTSEDTEDAIQWWKEGGIVTFCWHWNAPKELINEAPDKMWYSGFYTKATTFDVAKAISDPASEEYKLILRDIDAIAAQLKKLQNEDVPILWRPLHEASGAWFWWGAKGAEPCIRLWKLLYDRLTNHHQLHNLIWVWNGQHRDWYPGDDLVDIIGEDVYGRAHVYSSQVERFMQALDYTECNKVIALTENGPIPDPDLLIRDEVPWAWYCTWWGDYVCTEENGQFVYSEKYIERSMLHKIYNHDYVITRDSLPDLTVYPLD